MSTAITSTSYLARRPSPVASVTALRAWAPAAPVLRPLALARGNVVRIRDGCGALVHVRSGIVWVTEERSHRDEFLAHGHTHRIGRQGLTIVHADRDARVVLELRDAAAQFASIEVANAYGDDGRPLPRTARPASLLAHVYELAARARYALRQWWRTPRFPASWSEPRGQRPEDLYSPEAVRDRLLRASPHPYQ